MEEILVLLPIIMSWAVQLTGYEEPAALPAVELKPHEFFVENVCGGRECNAVGWYNDNGIIYLDETLTGDLQNVILFHETVHYLQDEDGHYAPNNCTDSVHREDEAYNAQNEYIIQAGLDWQLMKLPRMRSDRCAK